METDGQKLQRGTGSMTAVRWIMYRSVKESFPDVDVRITYGAKTKLAAPGAGYHQEPCE